MMTATGPKVLEYNARFGDPETQSLMMLLAPGCDLAATLIACCAGRLDAAPPLPLLPGFACNVVVAAGGYPNSYAQGDPIILASCPNCVQVFHAGTERSSDGGIETAGGRAGRFRCRVWGQLGRGSLSGV